MFGLQEKVWKIRKESVDQVVAVMKKREVDRGNI